jgi:membrane peptidoglycan carboxypeptidase
MDYGTFWANKLHFRDGIGVKTGTSEYKTDNWTFGYTNSYTVGVWVGNNDNTPMNPALASGVTGAAPIYHDIMAAVLNGKPQENFVRPDGIVDAQVDSLTGMLPNPDIPGLATKTEVFDKNNLPPIDDMHVKVRVCKPSGLLATPACEAAGQAIDQVYVVMYDPYSKQFPDKMKPLCNPCPPTTKDNTVFGPPATVNPTVTITSPTTVTKNFTAEATATGPTTITEVKFSLSTPSPQIKIAIFSSNKYKASFTNIPIGTYTLTAQVTDDFGNIGTTSIMLTVQ